MTKSQSPAPEDHSMPAPWVMRVSRTSWAFIGFVGAVGILAFTMAALHEIVIPLILSAVIAVWFAPIVDWLTRRGLKPSLAAMLTTLLTVALAIGAIAIVVGGLMSRGDELQARLDLALVEVEALIDQSDLHQFIETVEEEARNAAPAVRSGATSYLTSFLNSATGFASGLVLGLVLLYYLLKDGREIVSWAAKSKTAAGTAQNERIFGEAALSVRAYFRGRTSLAAVQGVAIAILTALMGVPLAAAIGIVNFIGAYIPYLGAFIGGAFAVLLALSDGGLVQALATLAAVLFVNLALENLLEPKLMGTSLNLHPIVVLLVTVAGGVLAGIVGLILAAPAVAIGRNLWRELQASGFFGPESTVVETAGDTRRGDATET